MLLPIAVLGFLVLGGAGVLLFLVHAPDYAANPFFQSKMAIVLVGLAGALGFHLRAGAWLESASAEQARLHGMLSMTCWIGALVCGRLIAYSNQ